MGGGALHTREKLHGARGWGGLMQHTCMHAGQDAASQDDDRMGRRKNLAVLRAAHWRAMRLRGGEGSWGEGTLPRAGAG